MQTTSHDLTSLSDVKKEMIKALSTGNKKLDQLVMLPKFHNVASKILAIALEELAFERMIEVNNDTYSIHQH